MASKASNALADMYKHWVAEMGKNPNATLEETRELFSHWGDVTADPSDVDYVEVDIDGMPAMWAIPKGCVWDRALLCSHGGGYVVGSMYTHRKMFGHMAKAVGCRALIVDYGLAPENIHPGPVNDMVKGYRWLIEQAGIKPEHIAFTGDSAGGALAITTVAAAKQQGLPVPAATMPISPWAAADTSGSTYDTNAKNDALVSRDTTMHMGSIFLGPANNNQDPLANPLYTDYSGFPPMYIAVGGYETLLDDSVRVAASAKKAGVNVTLKETPEMQHVFQFLAGKAPEADQSIKDMAKWVRPILGLK
jgi:acetyl esterase/lipase